MQVVSWLVVASLALSACSLDHTGIAPAQDAAIPTLTSAPDAQLPTHVTSSPDAAQSAQENTPDAQAPAPDAATSRSDATASSDAGAPDAQPQQDASSPLDAVDAVLDAQVQPSTSDAATTQADASLTIVVTQPDAATPPAAEERASLRISEVGSCYHFDSACWFELYNAGNTTEELSHYQVRSTAAAFFVPSAEHTFQLPSYALKPGQYALIAAASSKAVPDGQGLLHIRDGSLLPWWNSSGFIELLDSDHTIDFVRFGESTMQPRTPSAFGATSASELPSSAISYGYSLARSEAQEDRNLASDFSARAFATPRGPNDVTSDIDADNDGLPDQAEVSGGHFAGLDLYAMGARVGVRDVFVEVDRMRSSDPALTPQRAALDKLVAVFAEQHIALHLDVGNLFSTTFSPALYNLGGGNEVAFSPAIGFRPSDTAIADFYDYKAAHIAPERRAAFYYMLFASSQEADGSAGSSGIGEILGNDTIITLGASGLTVATQRQRNLLANYQAATMMHELGHNLSLRHGGFENQNYKPNYVSVMNYLYGALGLPVIGSHEGDRYDLTTGCSLYYVNELERAPTEAPSTFLLDFSHGESADIDEQHIFESEGLGRTQSSPVDYDCSATIDEEYAADLNFDGRKTVLRDHDDWANLRFVFARTVSSNDSGPTVITRVATRPVDVMVDDEQPVSESACATVGP